MENTENTSVQAENVEEVAKDEQQQQETQTFTQEEVNKIVNDRLKRAEKAQAKAIDEAIENYKKEQAKKADFEKLSKTEKLEKQIEELSAQNQKLIAEQQRHTLTAKARQELANEGLNLSDGMLSLVVGKDDETTYNNTKLVKEFADELFKRWENDRAKGSTPKSQAGGEAKPLNAFEQRIQEMKGKMK